MEKCNKKNAHRPLEIEQFLDFRVIDDLMRFSYITHDSGRSGIMLQYVATISYCDAIYIHVDNAGLRVFFLSDGVSVSHRRQPRSNVEKLVYALRDAESDGTAQESAIRQKDHTDIWHQFRELIARLTIRFEVMMTAQHVVEHAGHVRSI